MPAGQPFTRLCETLGDRRLGRADLHLHTTASDGTYTPRQVAEVAQRCGLAAIAVTDHDCVDGIEATRQAAKNTVEVITGIELTTELAGRELHLLGYFFDDHDADLTACLSSLQSARASRFVEMANRLKQRGVPIDDELVASANGSLGRRHLAAIMQQSGHVQTVHEAFQRYLSDSGPIQLPKQRLPIGDAIQLIHQAGGVTSLAHPPQYLEPVQWKQLAEMGLNAIEVKFQNCKPAHGRMLKEQARLLGLAVTGGSDCHGPEPARRGIGSVTVSHEELDALRAKSCGRL